MPIDLLDRVPPPADHRIHYGPDPLQFGDLRVPAVAPGHKAPLAVFLHGGWWKAEYGLEYGGHLCAALKAQGIATWSIEYRRVGNQGGGFPGTFEDVAAGFDFLATLGHTYPLDLGRIVVLGHSAGGHLAFWLAGRNHIPHPGPLAGSPPALPIHAVLGLAGAVDLRLVLELAGWFTFAHDRDEVINLIGGTPAAVPERYRAGNPGDLLPLNAVQVLLQGSDDDQIPPKLPIRWAERGRARGEPVTVEIIPGADHFDLVDPESKAWPQVLAATRHAFL